MMNTMNQTPLNPADHPTMSEQDLMDDLLSTEKQMVSSYSTLICEASCPNLRQVLGNNLNESIHNQFQVYQQMEQHGWYPTKIAQPQDVTQAKQKFQQMKNQL